jgi:hypothetical protein
MSLLLFATLFASLATAQLTTSIWLLGAANANQSFVGSVVTQQGDRTTLSVGFDGKGLETEYYGTGPGYVTLGGTTYVAYQATASDPGSDFGVTAYLECSRENGSAAPTCTMTTRDGASEQSLMNSQCANQLSGSYIKTYEVAETSFADGKPSTRTVTRTESNDCTGSVDYDIFPQTTMTMSGDEQYFMNTYKLVITAGTEKLGASAAATPTASGAQSTGNSTAGSSEAAQATGAAAPILAMAPVLAGLGAAAAFFV